MIDALINGKLLQDVDIKNSAKQTSFCNFLLTVAISEPNPVIVSGIAFNEAAEKIARLKKGDAVTVAGSLKPNQWLDKTTGETKHGLNIIVAACLSVFELNKRNGC